VDKSLFRFSGLTQSCTFSELLLLALKYLWLNYRSFSVGFNRSELGVFYLNASLTRANYAIHHSRQQPEEGSG